MKVLILAAVIIAVASATSPPYLPVYPAPPVSTYEAPAPDYATPAYKPQPAQPYSFEWEVKDVESYNDYSHSENSDGQVVTGSYRVQLPDGRTQIVTYRADSYGYTADVKYIGEAKYPEPATYSAPAYKAPAPAPAPAPVYKAPAPAPAPVYKAPAPAPVYKAPAPAPAPYKAPAPAPAPVYKAPAPAPAYKAPAPAPAPYKAPAPAPVYEAPARAYKVVPAIYRAAAPSYKVPSNPVY